MYYLLQEALGLTTNELAGGIVSTNNSAQGLSPVTWITDYGLFAIRLNAQADFNAPQWRSGVDGRGLSLQFAVNVVASGSISPGYTPLVFAETSALLNVGQFRALSVIS